MTKSKPFNNGTWTQARFNSFIKGGLRSLTRKWGPIHKVFKEARVERGKYRCAGFGCSPHIVGLTTHMGKRRGIRNVFVDHICPIIDPRSGFISWDDVIKRMFCEAEGLQVLCKECHDNKTKEERKARHG